MHSHLCACVEEKTSDRSENDSDNEEEGQDGLWCQDWSIRLMLVYRFFITHARVKDCLRRTAMPSVFVVGMRYLQADIAVSQIISLSRRSAAAARGVYRRVLAGLLLFCFLSPSDPASGFWNESVCSTCVCDMIANTSVDGLRQKKGCRFGEPRKIKTDVVYDVSFLKFRPPRSWIPFRHQNATGRG